MSIPPDLPPNYPPQKKSTNPGCIVGFVALAIAISPILIGIFGSIGCPQPANEGNCAAAAAPWLMFLSIPVGFIMGVVGIIIYFVENKKKK
jgi:hypothetical protein